MNINFEELKGIISSNGSKASLAQNSSKCLNNFIALTSNMMEITQKLTQEELSNFILSLQNYILHKDHTKCYEKPQIGDIFYTDLGNCYKPEIAYPHPTILLSEVSNMFLIVPISTATETLKIAYHPIDNPKGSKKYRKVGEEDGFDHNCVVMLANFRTISKGRLIKKKGSLDINSKESLFNEIKSRVIKLAFPQSFIEYSKIKEGQNICMETLNSINNILKDILPKEIQNNKESEIAVDIVFDTDKIKEIENLVNNNISLLENI